MAATNTSEIVTICPETAMLTKQQLPNFVGISAASAGAKHLSMNLVIIPPGGAAQPHVHRGYETAIYLYYTVAQNAAGLQYHRTIRLDYDGAVTTFRFFVSKPEQEAPEGFREFLESAARQGYERLPACIQADVESGRVSAEYGRKR